MENVISCKNLTHYYGKRLIYKDLSFNVPKGRILGLLGKMPYLRAGCTKHGTVITS